MKFQFTKFGGVDSGSVELGDLTIICGPNNVGKTYISYAIYGFINRIHDWVDSSIVYRDVDQLLTEKVLGLDLEQYLQKLPEILRNASDQFSEELSNYFKVGEEYFSEANIVFSLDIEANKFDALYETSIKSGINFGKKEEIIFLKKEGEMLLTITLAEYRDQNSKIPREILRSIISDHIMKILLRHLFPEAFAVTSERTGIALFYKELDINKNIILEQLMDTDTVNPLQLLANVKTRYAQPIHDNIQVIRDFEEISKQKSFIRKDKDNPKYKAILDNLQDLMGGSYKLVNKQLTYCPKKIRNRKKVEVPVYVASSSIKSLFLIDLYVNCLAKKNGWLIIDEPELNLHPSNQRKMASLLASLVNAGIKVIVTTHSDYLIRELNNRIMLNSVNDKERVINELKWDEYSLLTPDQIQAYVVKDYRIHKQKVNKFGIELSIFDSLIEESNDVTDFIFQSMDLNQ